jgi:hypothetical protein
VLVVAAVAHAVVVVVVVGAAEADADEPALVENDFPRRGGDNVPRACLDSGS